MKEFVCLSSVWCDGVHGDGAYGDVWGSLREGGGGVAWKEDMREGERREIHRLDGEWMMEKRGDNCQMSE